MPVDRPIAPGLRHVADIATLQRGERRELRIALFESARGYVVELRHAERERDGTMAPAGPGILVHLDRLPELVVGLERARSAASALRGAA